jgi:Mn-dependent DtxR family transcriptional regulator
VPFAPALYNIYIDSGRAQLHGKTKIWEGARRLRDTISREDYLEAIFLLSQKSKRANGGIRAATVAGYMGYSATATHRAMLRLEKDNLIRFDNSKIIYLTEEGYSRAMKIYEKHMFFAWFLMKFGGMDTKEAEDAACEIEHAISDRVFELFKDFHTEYQSRPCGKLGFCPRERPDGTEM